MKCNEFFENLKMTRMLIVNCDLDFCDCQGFLGPKAHQASPENAEFKNARHCLNSARSAKRYFISWNDFSYINFSAAFLHSRYF